MDAANFSVNESLRDGGRFTIRSLKPEDRAAFVEAVSQTSSQSIYRRFFAPRRNFTEGETSFFVNIDFAKHVALIAVVAADGGRQNCRRRTLYSGATGRGGIGFYGRGSISGQRDWHGASTPPYCDRPARWLART